MSRPAPKTTNPVGRPLNESVAATGHIHLRVVLARKNWYVRMARMHNLTLAEWMQRVCDEESGYPPKSQLVTANAPHEPPPTGDSRKPKTL